MISTFSPCSFFLLLSPSPQTIFSGSTDWSFFASEARSHAFAGLHPSPHSSSPLPRERLETSMLFPALFSLRARVDGSLASRKHRHPNLSGGLSLGLIFFQHGKLEPPAFSFLSFLPLLVESSIALSSLPLQKDAESHALLSNWSEETKAPVSTCARPPSAFANLFIGAVPFPAS